MEVQLTKAEAETKLAALEIEREEIESALADIRGQIGKSSADFHETGEGRGSAWYAKAKAALRYKGADHQDNIREAARLRKLIRAMEHAEAEAKREKPLHLYFYQVAESDLPRDLFKAIFAKALVQKELAA